MNKESLELLRVLLDFRRITKPNLPYGICGALSQVQFTEFNANLRISRRMYELFTSWPEYSGYAAFPVPCTYRKSSDAFLEAAAHNALWDDSDYGQARRRLLDFCIRELEKERDTSLLKKLQLYRARVPDVPGGICSAIDACYDLSTRLSELFVSWPKAEDNSMYPVPYGDNSSLTRSYAYNSFYRNHDLWGDHEYGKNRRELLDYCIHKLEASLAE